MLGLERQTGVRSVSSAVLRRPIEVLAEVQLDARLGAVDLEPPFGVRLDDAGDE